MSTHDKLQVYTLNEALNTVLSAADCADSTALKYDNVIESLLGQSGLISCPEESRLLQIILVNLKSQFLIQI